MARHPTALFYEEQRLRERAISLVVLAAGVFMIAFFAYVMYQQLILGKPFGDEPMGDTHLLIFGPVYMALGLVLILIFYKGRLVTELRPDGIYVRFSPFHHRCKQFPLNELAEYEAVSYRPIRDFGGWGIRIGRGGWAYNVSGNQGVQLKLKNGKRVMIGSKNPRALVDAIRSATT
ncbi:MAG: DUF6141 family protein [Candidatus Krumholzibacteriia bacterium]